MNMNERLTDEEIDNVWLMRYSLHGGDLMLQLRDFARAIESAVLARAGVPAVQPTYERAEHLMLCYGSAIKNNDNSTAERCLAKLGDLFAAPQAPAVQPKWQPIETAPKDGRTLLLGHFNSRGKWRTVRGQWFSADAIAESWEEPDDCDEGWYETTVECDDMPNCWATDPTHWMPLPAAPHAEAWQEQPTALDRFNENSADLADESPLERLRYFLSLALKGQDWLDVEPFLDAPGVALPRADQSKGGA